MRTDRDMADECATTWRAKREAIEARTHGPEHDCSDCSASFRQGRSLASVESSAVGFLVAALGIVALLVVAWVLVSRAAVRTVEHFDTESHFGAITGEAHEGGARLVFDAESLGVVDFSLGELEAAVVFFQRLIEAARAEKVGA